MRVTLSVSYFMVFGIELGFKGRLACMGHDSNKIFQGARSVKANE